MQRERKRGSRGSGEGWVEWALWWGIGFPLFLTSYLNSSFPDAQRICELFFVDQWQERSRICWKDEFQDFRTDTWLLTKERTKTLGSVSTWQKDLLFLSLPLPSPSSLLIMKLAVTWQPAHWGNPSIPIASGNSPRAGAKNSLSKFPGVLIWIIQVGSVTGGLRHRRRIPASHRLLHVPSDYKPERKSRLKMLFSVQHKVDLFPIPNNSAGESRSLWVKSDNIYSQNGASNILVNDELTYLGLTLSDCSYGYYSPPH